MKRQEVQQENKIRQDKLNKGKEILEQLRQNQYNTYLQDEAATNFGKLSAEGALKQQKKALQRELTQVQGHQFFKNI